MKIIIANDHAAVAIKERLQNWLNKQGHTVVDLGVDANTRADYPDKAIEATNLFLEGGYDYGILCCGTGIGVSITANKVRGIRCALPQNSYAAAMAIEHNNCQFIAFGGRIDYQESPEDILNAFQSTKYLGTERHQRRIDKITDTESKASSLTQRACADTLPS